MKRYRFRLEQVRNVRRVQEDLSLAAMRHAENEAAQAAEAAAARLARYARESAPLAEAIAGSFAADHERLARAAAAVEAAGRALGEARAQADARRGEWSDAARRVAALDRLDERKRGEHAVEAVRDGDRLVDDIVMARKRADD
jgi:flagellar export protein FliJ